MNKPVLAVSMISALAAGSAFAAQVPYATFSGAGAVSNMTFISPDGSGCTANCEDVSPVYGSDGYAVEGTNDVTFTWDGTIFGSSTDYIGPGGASNASISAVHNIILGVGWNIHDVQIFGPGTYSFDTSAGGAVGDNETGMLSMTVGAGQLGVHLLMDWSASTNIDILNVWNINSVFSNCAVTNVSSTASNCLWMGHPSSNPAGNNASTVFQLASTDNDGDGTLGIPVAQGGPFYDPNYGGFNFNFNLQGSMTVVPIPAAVWLFGSGLLGLLGLARRKKKI